MVTWTNWGRRKGEIFGNEARLHKDTAAEKRMTQRRKPTPCFDTSGTGWRCYNSIAGFESRFGFYVFFEGPQQAKCIAIPIDQ